LDIFLWTVTKLNIKGIKLSDKAVKIIANDLTMPRKAAKETKEFVKRSMEAIKETNKNDG